MQFLKVMQEKKITSKMQEKKITSKYSHIHSNYIKTIHEENRNLTLIRLQSILLGNIIYSVTDPSIELTPLIMDSGLGNPKFHGIQNQCVSFSIKDDFVRF